MVFRKIFFNILIVHIVIRFPPLAQACSLCPIHNSQFSPRPTRPICPTLPTSPIIPNSQFKIHNLPIPLAPPLAQASSLCPIHNSKFKIHNLPIPLALFRVLYRLKKLFSLWWVKEYSGVVLLYCIDCKAIEILTTHLIYYLHYPSS